MSCRRTEERLGAPGAFPGAPRGLTATVRWVSSRARAPGSVQPHTPWAPLRSAPVVAVLVGCASGQGAVLPPSSAAARHEPPSYNLSAPPEDGASWRPAAAAASTGDHRLLVLQAPRSKASALRLVRSFFVAIYYGDAKRLDALLKPDASIALDDTGERQLAADHWGARLQRHDYGRAPIFDLVAEENIELYTSDALHSLLLTRAPARTIEPEELLVRVRIPPPTSGMERLFGEEILFVLSPEGGGYRIAELSERYSDL